MALEEHGDEKVHQHVGHEPSGASFDELTLNKKGRPHNPLINAGAIMCCSLIGQTEKAAARAGGAKLDQPGWEGRRLDFVMETWRRLSGGAEPRFNSPVYLSERQTADRNFALAYFMREKGAFPSDVELEDVLDFYFQSCSVEMTAEMMSVVAATLANGGICPVTGERVFAPDTVQRVLSLMSTCGMYDYSGEFVFRIGLPAKSGVSGAIMVVVPNVVGFCTWSPRLDELGNSVRGIDFFRRLVDAYNFHNFDNLSGITAKKDPRLDRIAQRARMVNELIWAASKGDLGLLQQQTWRGAELNPPDYDMRTPLHLPAAEGQAEVVRYFIEREREGDTSIDMNPRDRWGGTPLNDAYRHGHMDVVGLLKASGGLQGVESAEGSGVIPTPSYASAPDKSASSEMIWAASAGDLLAVRRLVARGVPLGVPDYDARTPLHLAAAEGHLEVVTYLLTQGVDANCQDRWGHTPEDDARRHSRKKVAAALEKHADKRATIRRRKKPLAARPI